MRNRQIIEYFLYPRFFNSLSVLYKGVYCVSFKLYHLTKSKTTTYAYPFPTTILNPSDTPDKYEPPSAHLDGNFSYQTQRYFFFLHSIYIVYEEERKKLTSHAVFRLQYEISKEYTTYLSCKLMKKQSTATKEEGKFCVKKQTDVKYQTIDTQVLEIKKGNLNRFEKVTFRASEFFSSIDFYLSTFNYGFKLYRNKMQISHLLAVSDLSKTKPINALTLSLQPSTSKPQKKKDNELLKYKQLCDVSLTQTYYIELQSMLNEYDRWLKQYDSLQKDIEREIKRPLKIEHDMSDLNYIRMQKPVIFSNLIVHYQTDRPEEILVCILEEKQLIRKNMRMLRIFFSELITCLPDKMFTELVMKNVEDRKAVEQKYFIRHLEKLNPKEEEIGDRRSQASFDYTRDLQIINEKMKKCPYLFVENYSQQIRQDKYRIYTLTVFVHGYQGNSFDFQKARNYLKKMNKYTHILIVESITGDMNESIESLGKTAASQVSKYIENTPTRFQFINFIGFSLGGIIARSAFQHLEDYKQKFGIFITFSSPHLGISESQNSLVNLGVWYLIKVDKVINLKQLNFQSVKMHESLLMKLSKCDYISYFRKVVLVCSKDDGFVPFYSTVLEESFCDKEIRELCENIKRNIRKMERVQVVFDVAHAGTLDKLTGRKGHIEFLDNDYFLQMFFKLYGSQL